MSGAWETVVGLEVHVQLLTKTKMFCGCRTNYGDPPNTNVCPVCLGLPGALPVANEQAVRLAVRAAYALECAVHPRSVFARKNYFYPDLPKGYQISQFDEPLSTRGKLEIVSPERGPLTIGITRVHLEEDAGKSFHDRYPGATAVDLNRSGVPLIEIVSEPDMRSPAEARAYLTALKQVLRWLGVSDCNMEEGSLRVDANLSIRRPGDPLGTRTEVKNMNSFSGVERALGVERERQVALVESGGAVVQSTMTFDAAKGEIKPMRSKEESHDYRYFPEPDLPPLVLKDAWLAAERDSLPELPAARRERFVRDYAITPQQAGVLAASGERADYFEAVAKALQPRQAANLIINDILAIAVDDAIPLSAEATVAAGKLILGDWNRIWTKPFLEALVKGPAAAPADVARAMGFVRETSAGDLDAWIAETLAAHPGEVSRFKAGEEKLMGFFTGQVMKKSKGKADPKAVGAALAKALAAT